HPSLLQFLRGSYHIRGFEKPKPDGEDFLFLMMLVQGDPKRDVTSEERFIISFANFDNTLQWEIPTAFYNLALAGSEDKIARISGLSLDEEDSNTRWYTSESFEACDKFAAILVQSMRRDGELIWNFKKNVPWRRDPPAKR